MPNDTGRLRDQFRKLRVAEKPWGSSPPFGAMNMQRCRNGNGSAWKAVAGLKSLRRFDSFTLRHICWMMSAGADTGLENRGGSIAVGIDTSFQRQIRSSTQVGEGTSPLRRQVQKCARVFEPLLLRHMHRCWNGRQASLRHWYLNKVCEFESRSVHQNHDQLLENFPLRVGPRFYIRSMAAGVIRGAADAFILDLLNE